MDSKVLKHKQSTGYILCLNPNCPSPSQRCLSTSLLHSHPSQCSHHYYPAQEVMKNWQQLPDYPNDSLGKAILKKFKHSQSHSFLKATLDQFRIKISNLLDHFEKKLLQIYPYSILQNDYEQVYNLSSIAKALHEDNDPKYITKLINGKVSKPKYTSLLLLNERYDELVVSLQNVSKGLRNSLNDLIITNEKGQSIKKTLPEKYATKIHYGMMKSKFIASSKISCVDGMITFPHIQKIASFLPWLYTDRSFSTGNHQLRICSQKFPLVSNCGLMILQEHDIDTYPYHYFKSIFSKEGRGFTLVQGSQLEHIISATTTVTLKLKLGNKPQAQLYDSERRSIYVCELKEDRDYRMGVYGSGWSTIITQLH